MRPRAFIPDTVFIEQSFRTDIQLSAERVCCDGDIRIYLLQIFQKHGSRSFISNRVISEYSRNCFQHRIRWFLPGLGLSGNEFPEASLLIKFQTQFLILLVPANNREDSRPVRSLLLFQDKCPVSCTQKTIRAGDHIEAVLRFHLPRMMHDQEADAVLISKSFQALDHLVVLGIAVLLAAKFADPLQGIDDDEHRVRMSGNELLHLCLKPICHAPGICRKVQTVGTLYIKHPGQPFLESCIVIFKSQIQDRTLPHRIIPKRDPGRDMIGQLCHKEGFPDLWRSGKDIGSGIEKPFHDRRLRLVHPVVKLSHRDFLEGALLQILFNILRSSSFDQIWIRSDKI